MSAIPSDVPLGHLYDVVIVGAGAAGIGVAITLQHAGIENFVVLERSEIGASFRSWPAETRFITPSFPTNSIGMLDINAVALGTSPAFTLAVEHPTGEEYADYLTIIAEHFEVPIREHTDMLTMNKQAVEEGEIFVLETANAPIQARHVIWAAGDFQYPRLDGFTGSELCRHTATIPSYATLEGDDFIVIGGYESGVDVAHYLAKKGKRVRIFDKENPWDPDTSDPSVALSTYSLERIYSKAFETQVEVFPDAGITSVIALDEGYEVITEDGSRFQTPVPPLLAGGFVGSQTLISDMFETREQDGLPLLSEHDESTITPGLFLCGAAVRHDNHIFCFIYKYRQRFAVVAKEIATSLGLAAEELEEYRTWNMYLDDLSCCGEECLC